MCWILHINLKRQGLYPACLGRMSHCLNNKSVFEGSCLMVPAPTGGKIVFMLLEVSAALVVFKLPILILFHRI